MTDTNGLDGQPIIFGEVLFDCFPDGAEVLGGAPFNVAWHLTGFGLKPLMISRIGTDDHGEQIRQAMRSWGMIEDGIQVDPEHPTGIVQVTFDGGHPSFTIKAGHATEFIDLEAARRSLDPHAPSILYHGTVIRRGDTSRATLHDLRDNLGLPTFVDLNLRHPWDRDDIVNSLQGADWLKLNDNELTTVLNEETKSTSACIEGADRVLRLYECRQVIITRGEEGAFLIDGPGHPVTAEPVPVKQMQDTVGAGDAFSSVLILGLHAGWDAATTLQRAVAFASAICGIQGATTRQRDLYKGFLADWGLDGGHS